MTAADAPVTLATVVRPQGRHGEVLCDLLTDFPARFTEATSLQLALPNRTCSPVTVLNFWLPTGRNAGRVVLKLAGIDSILSAEEVRGAHIQLPREQRAQLEASTYYVADMVGCHLYDGDLLVGQVTDVQFPTDSSGKHLLDAAALFVVSQEPEGSVLIPFANEFVCSIDVEGRAIHMKLPAGLTDLNAG